MTEIIIYSGRYDEDITHNGRFGTGAGTAGANNIGVRIIKSLITESRIQAERAVDLALTGYKHRNVALNIQLVIFMSAFYLVLFRPVQIFFIV